MTSDTFMQRAFPNAKVIPHVDPNRFTIDLLGDTRPRLPVGEWDLVERHALTEVKP